MTDSIPRGDAEAIRLWAEDWLAALAGEDVSVWPALRHLYEVARLAAPDDPDIVDSAAASALHFADLIAGPADERGLGCTHRELVDQAKAFAAQAVALAPHTARHHRVLGAAWYADPDAPVGEALAHFDAALLWDPGDAWARLYRAHCLHDLERWEEAAKAYAEVAYDRLGAHAAWRRWLASEQRGWCLLRAGDVESAEAAFADVLTACEVARSANSEELLDDALFACPSPLFLRAVEEGALPTLAERLHVLRVALDEV